MRTALIIESVKVSRENDERAAFSPSRLRLDSESHAQTAAIQQRATIAEQCAPTSPSPLASGRPTQSDDMYNKLNKWNLLKYIIAKYKPRLAS